MAIARSLVDKEAVVSFQGLRDIYRVAMLELKDLAGQRMATDARRLTAEAKRARQLEREAAAILRRVDTESAEWIAENIPKSYVRGARDAAVGLAEIGAEVGTVNPIIHEQAIQILVADLQDDLQALNQMVERGVQRLRRSAMQAALDKRVGERIGVGIIKGTERRLVSADIAKRIRQEMGFDELYIRIGGKKWTPEAYAEMLARTKTAEAQSRGMEMRLIEEGQDLVMITAHGAKDGCAFYEGKVFSISGTSEKYPPLRSLPNGGVPFHPNCKHAEVPFVEELSSGAEKRRAVGVPDEARGKTFAEVNKLPEVPDVARRQRRNIRDRQRKVAA